MNILFGYGRYFSNIKNATFILVKRFFNFNYTNKIFFFLLFYLVMNFNILLIYFFTTNFTLSILIKESFNLVKMLFNFNYKNKILFVIPVITPVSDFVSNNAVAVVACTTCAIALGFYSGDIYNKFVRKNVTNEPNTPTNNPNPTNEPNTPTNERPNTPTNASQPTNELPNLPTWGHDLPKQQYAIHPLDPGDEWRTEKPVFKEWRTSAERENDYKKIYNNISVLNGSRVFNRYPLPESQMASKAAPSPIDPSRVSSAGPSKITGSFFNKQRPPLLYPETFKAQIPKESLSLMKNNSEIREKIAMIETFTVAALLQEDHAMRQGLKNKVLLIPHLKFVLIPDYFDEVKLHKIEYEKILKNLEEEISIGGPIMPSGNLKYVSSIREQIKIKSLQAKNFKNYLTAYNNQCSPILSDEIKNNLNPSCLRTHEVNTSPNIRFKSLMKLSTDLDSMVNDLTLLDSSFTRILKNELITKSFTVVRCDDLDADIKVLEKSLNTMNVELENTLNL
jgi:hypothetical protein